MSFQLDPAILAAMNQEAKKCFLEVDAPEYLYNLQIGIKQGLKKVDFNTMLRAAHSLKGGAGLAQLPGLRELTHKLEDLIEAIEKKAVAEPEEAWLLLEWGVNEVAMLLNQAQTESEVTADLTLLQALDTVVLQQELEAIEPPKASNVNVLVEKALQQDLESCLARIEALSFDESVETVIESIETFLSEGLLLGETLNLPWLVEGIETLERRLGEVEDENSILWIALEVVGELRIERDRHLESLLWQPPAETILEPEAPSLPVGSSQVRVPLEKLESISNKVEELLLAQQRLKREQQQLQIVYQNIRQVVRQFEPIRDQVQTIYDQLAISSVINTRQTSGFDSLELDSYSDFHSSLQSLQELMLQVLEVNTDLNIINREFSEDLEQVDHNLEALYTEVTESRLVPFRVLSGRFPQQMQYLNQRYGKSANLAIAGEEVLVDQVLLEQLQTPLTHLLNNAFDHGIEFPEERLAEQKSATAEISLKAKIDNNLLVITLQDDGRGINLQKVYQKAVAKGLCPNHLSFEQLTKQQLLSWIFSPNFSTAQVITDLSGRGVGLDIVRRQIQQLRGTVQVDTEAGQHTTFTLKLPLNLSFSSLLLVQWQAHLLAIPTLNVLETFPYSEISWLETTVVRWQGLIIPYLSLSQLLPFRDTLPESVPPKVAIVLDSSQGKIVVGVEAIHSQKELIIKPFDDTVAVPPYLAGCTLVDNQVVPVILPQGFDAPHSLLSLVVTGESTPKPKLNPTIFVVEDSAATRGLLQRLLTEVGYSVVLCRDGKEALDQLRESRVEVDLIVSDVEMPRVNGFELLTQLQNHDPWQSIPVIMATSRISDRHRHRAFSLGAKAYLGKPLNPQELLATIESLLPAV